MLILVIQSLETKINKLENFVAELEILNTKLLQDQSQVSNVDSTSLSSEPSVVPLQRSVSTAAENGQFSEATAALASFARINPKYSSQELLDAAKDSALVHNC